MNHSPVIANTTYYAEYESTGTPSLRYSCQKHLIIFQNGIGPGGNTTARISLEHILSSAEANDFTIKKVFLGQPRWIDFEYLS